MRFNKIILLLLIGLTITSCRKDDVSEPTTVGVLAPFEITNTYTVDIQGIVLDPEGNAIPDARIFVNGMQTVSSEDGVFLIEKALAPQNGLYINADALGYFEGGSSIYAHENQVYTVEITLIPFDNLREFDTGLGLSYISDDGVGVEIPANAIIDEQGNTYNGAVSFYSYWINPTDENLPNLSPGSLVGVQDDELVSLQSFGMIAVEMYGTSGQELNMAEGTTAQLTFPVPTELQSSAESEIDLWHFDEITGRWIHEGNATLTNGSYEAEVSHFSWWNCDVPFASVYFCFNVIDDSGNPIGNVTLDVYAQNFGYASANIGSLGTYCDLVPVGQDLDITVSTHCGDELYSQTIQVGSEDESVDIMLPFGSGEIDLVNVSGQVTCNGADPVSNGYAVLSLGEETYVVFLDDNGNYAINVINCLNEVYDASVTGYNLDDLTGGTIELMIGQDDIVGLDIDACEDDLTQEIMIITGSEVNTDATLFDCQANISAAEITIIAKGINSTGTADDFVILGVAGFDEGTFGGNIISSLVSNLIVNDGEINQVVVTIDSYSDVPGEQISGEFNYDNGLIMGSFVATVQ